jgi:hypothetical protein
MSPQATHILDWFGSLVITGLHNSMLFKQIRNTRLSPAGFFETNA